MSEFTEKQIIGMQKALAELCDWYHQLEVVTISAKESVLIDVDTNMGFVYIGPMANPLAEKRVPKVVELYSKASQKDVKIVRAAESHESGCLEFNDYPPHCVKDDEEAEPVPELRNFKVDLTVFKNSTNAFHEDSMKDWLNECTNINTIVICGFVTDVCVMQLAVSLKTYCNNIGRKIKIVVCESAAMSYDLQIGDIQKNHNADLSHLMALRFMHDAGIIIASDVVFE